MSEGFEAITVTPPVTHDSQREYERELESLPAFSLLPRLKSGRYLTSIATTILPLFVADLLAVTLSLVIAWTAVSLFLPITPYLFLGRRLVAASLLIVVVYPLFGLYPGVGLNPILEFRQTAMAASLVYGFLIISGAIFGVQQTFELWVLVLGWLTAFLLAPSCRSLMRHLVAGRRWWTQPVLIVGDGKIANEAFQAILRTPLHGLRPAGIVGNPNAHWSEAAETQQHFLGALDELPEIAEAQAAYWVILTPRYTSDISINLVSAIVPNVIMLPESGNIPCLWNRPQMVMDRSAIYFQERLLLPLPRILKRTIDLILVTMVSIALSPLLLLLCFLTKMTSRGPVFYRQRRIGRHGKIFSMWKFRSMVHDAEHVLEVYLDRHPELREQWERDHKLKNDPRATWLGRFMRKWSLDELPQLWNVLCGEMSLVGPRPIVDSEEGRCYLRDHPDGFSQYVRVVPGITGLWQISGRSLTTYEERIRLDSFYVRNWSPWLDLYILLKTFRAVIMCQGAC